MKRCLAIAVAVLLAYQWPAAALSSALSSPTVVWVGLDYSMVRMFGSGDFTNPDQIFPSMFSQWNALYLKEKIEDLGKRLHKQVIPDTMGIIEINKQAQTSQVVREDGDYAKYVTASHITPDDIANAVRSYKLSQDTGLGLVFIVDRLVRLHETGCLYVVYFDIASREVLKSERKIAKTGGRGFRNHWFGFIKDITGTLK